jgi:hypothetical protein
MAAAPICSARSVCAWAGVERKRCVVTAGHVESARDGGERLAGEVGRALQSGKLRDMTFAVIYIEVTAEGTREETQQCSS